MDRRVFIKKATMAAAATAVVSPASAMLDTISGMQCTEKMAAADALIVGTPVYYGQPNGGILSLMQRLFFSAGHLVQNKPAEALAVCRRGGATATLQAINRNF